MSPFAEGYQAPSNPVTAKQLRFFERQTDDFGVELWPYWERYNVTTPSELTREQASEIIQEIIDRSSETQ